MEKNVAISKRIKILIKKIFPNNGYIRNNESESICKKVFSFPYLSAVTFEISTPLETKKSLSELIEISRRIIIMVKINKQIFPVQKTKKIRTEETKILSASKSRRDPKFEVILYLLAKKPSKKSDQAAAVNTKKEVK